MARNADTKTTTRKNRQVNASIPEDLFKVLDDYRWEARIDGMPKLVAKALEEYAENHGLTPAPESAPAE